MKRKGIIHVTVRSSSNSGSTKASCTSENILSSDSLSRQPEILSNHFNNYAKVQSQNNAPNWPSLERNHQQYANNNKKKKNSTTKKLCLGLVIGLITMIILAVILVIIFIVIIPKSKINRNAILRWNTTGVTVANQLYSPNGLAFDWSQALYIAESGKNRVQRYLHGASNGTTVCGQMNGTSGTDASQLNYPRKILVTSNRSIYVADWQNHRVQFWPVGSSSGITIAGTGIAGYGLNELTAPQAMHIIEESHIFYVADTGNHRVMRYFLNATTGDVVAGGNLCGTNKTQICDPTGLDFDITTNSFTLVDYNLNTIMRWKIGDSKWVYVAGSVSMLTGNSSIELNKPESLAIDPMGNAYVADKSNHRIQFFPINQSNGMTIAGITAISGNNATLLSYPCHALVDNQLNLYVSDTSNGRLQKFLRY